MEKYLPKKQFIISGVIKLTKAEVDAFALDFALPKNSPFYVRLKRYFRENKEIERGIWVVEMDKECLVHEFGNPLMFRGHGGLFRRLTDRFVVSMPENPNAPVKIFCYSDLFSEATLL